MSGKGATIHWRNAAAFPVNDNMPISMAVVPASWHDAVPRFLDDEVSGARRALHCAREADPPAETSSAIGRSRLGLLAWRQRHAARIALHASTTGCCATLALARCDIEQVVRQIRSPDPAPRLSN